MSASRILGLMVVSAWLEVGCSGAKKIDVGGACILNSDCNSPLMCTMGKCHDACHTSADCPTGQSCVTASNQSTVCQLPAEVHCLYASDCQPPLKCAVDQRCHNECQTNADCPSGQTCTTTKACAEPNQVDINNNLIAPDGGVSGTGGAPGAGGAGGSAEAGVPDGPGARLDVSVGGSGGGAGGIGGGGGADAGVVDSPGARLDVSVGGSGGGTGGIGGGGGADARVADAPGAQPDVSTGGTGGGAGGIGGGGSSGAGVPDAPGARLDVSVGGSGGGAGGIGGGGGADAGVLDAPGAQPDVSIGGTGGGAGGIGGGGGADAGVADAIVADAPAGTGGTVGTGGNVGTGGTTSAGNPPGYYVTKDWNVTSVDWHGCVWTYVDDTVRLSTTNITPLDFTTATTEGGPYSVTGTVFNDYNSFAMVGFNLNESVTGSSTQCAHDLSKLEAVGPPAATMPGSATGIAFNWSRGQASTNFRIQIQSSDAYTNANHRWCAAIPDAGASFIRFSDFYTQCWYLGTVNSPGTQYDGEPIDAVVFLVAGTEPQRTPFDFTIIGFAPGTSVADAP